MKNKLIISTLIAAATLFTSITTNAASLLDTIMERNELRVAIPIDYPPYGFVGRTMEPEGIDIEVAKLIAENMGVEIKLIPVTGPNRIPSLQTGKADLTISSLGKNAERAKVIDYSIAYAPFFDGVYGSSKEDVTNFDDLAGREVGVTRGSMEDDALTIKSPKAILKRFEDNNSTISGFLSGQISFMAIGTPVAGIIKERNPDIDLEMKVLLSNSPCYVGLPKGEKELVAKVNSILRAAKADGTIDALSKEWLGGPAGDLPE